MSKTYEDFAKDLSALPKKELDKKIIEVKQACTCKNCPTRNSTKEKNLGFCAIGKSKIISVDKGCLCPTCPVTKMLALRWDHYCMKGSAAQMAGIAK